MKYKKNLRIEGSKVYSYTTHVATINHTDRTLAVHGYWSITTSKHINHVADTYGLTKIKADKEKEPENDNSGMLRSIAMVANLGNIFADTQEQKNAWKLRMLKAGLENKGLILPEDFDTLPEEEKERRLNGAIEAIS